MRLRERSMDSWSNDWPAILLNGRHLRLAHFLGHGAQRTLTCRSQFRNIHLTGIHTEDAKVEYIY